MLESTLYYGCVGKQALYGLSEPIGISNRIIIATPTTTCLPSTPRQRLVDQTSPDLADRHRPTHPAASTDLRTPSYAAIDLHCPPYASEVQALATTTSHAVASSQ
ncbi:hypothetical protein F4803DRAFT_558014 [Xylaria telfairii]|nr:hypothetical protein F4803DRAFT_558014 [Xylaria telfairii]